MSIETSIRKAELKDLDDITDIEILCFPYDKFSRRQLAYLISKSQGGCLVMHQGNIAVAYASLLKRSSSQNLRIYSIAVTPQGQGNHIGQQLLEHIIEYAKLQDFKKITLEVNVNNNPAINLYKKYGFTINGIIEKYYHDGSNAYRMFLDVT